MADKFNDVARGTDHDLAFKWQLPSEGRAQSRLGYVRTDNKRADGANVDDVELSELFGDERWLASIRPPNIHRTKKYDPAHSKKYYSGCSSVIDLFLRLPEVLLDDRGLEYDQVS